MNLHPTNVTQKVQFILEHFAANVAHRLDGKAKAMVVTSSRAAVIRYKLGFDRFIAKHPEYSHIQSLVAFSGKLTGKQVMHADDDRIAGEVFVIDENGEFTEVTMNPEVAGQDLRIAFDRPEYRVMLVADKFQTGFDQPKLVAMYVDKKIANDVEVVQTFSRLNRTAPGKDDTFIIDFVNEPENVLRAFAKYDAGAVIEDVQDPNVVYEIKQALDAQGLYVAQDLADFKAARFQTIHDLAQAKEPQHKALYAATERATRVYNQRLKVLQEAVATWETAFEKAHAQGDKAGMKAADHQRHQYGNQMKELLAFKDGLARFCGTYAYVAQLLDFGDPELENFAAFTKLLYKRLIGVAREMVDLSGLVLTGYDITYRGPLPVGVEEPVLQPIGPGGQTKKGDDPHYLKEIIDRLNSIFGHATPVRDQAAFANQIASIAKESEAVVAQIENNTREQALKGNLPGAVEQGVVRALTSHQKLATLVLKSDKQAMSALTDVIYDLIRSGKLIDLDALGAAAST